MAQDDLRKEYPHLAKFIPYIELLAKESDRGKVLISTGFIEEQLKEVLLAFMLDKPSATELVTGGNAALGSLSSRISACYLLGLISEDEEHDLSLIRRIRNDFAHDIHTSFKTRSVIDRCKILRLKAHDYTSLQMGEVVMTPGAQFETSAVSLIMNLTNRATYVARKRLSYGNWQR